ncbi:MAG: hypothetical protein MUE79_01460 [Nitratireductor sp.]|jgi:hypothetical protein|nr:hypothetical protein [Nitratireductor sp.]
MHPLEITVVPAKVFAALGKIVVFLVLAHLGAVGLHQPVQNDFTGWLLRVFHLDVEGNVPSFFACFLWGFNAFLFGLVWKTQRREQAGAWPWLVLVAVFWFFAFDEVASVHEQLVPACRAVFDAGGVFSFAWIIPYGVGILLVAVLLLPRVWQQSRPVRFWFVWSVFVGVAGSMGLEMLEGYYLETHVRDVPYFCMMTMEETLEMAGLTGLVHAALLLLEQKSGGIAVRLPGARPS